MNSMHRLFASILLLAPLAACASDSQVIAQAADAHRELEPAVLEDPQLASVLNDEGAVPSMDELVSNVITQDSPALQEFQPVVDDSAGLLLAGGLKAAGFAPAVHGSAAPSVANASMILPAP